MTVAKKSISTEQAKQDFGIYTNHEAMPNGELRFRLMSHDGNGYIRTVARAGGGWQSAHSHIDYREIYIVEKRWMAVAIKQPAGGVGLKMFTLGDTYCTSLGEVHNVYLPEGAIIHTVKFGAHDSKTNWNEDSDFTARTQGISEAEIFERIRRSA